MSWVVVGSSSTRTSVPPSSSGLLVLLRCKPVESTQLHAESVAIRSARGSNFRKEFKIDEPLQKCDPCSLRTGREISVESLSKLADVNHRAPHFQ